MKTEEEKNKILLLRKEGMGYKKIANLTGLSRNCVRGICLQRSNMQKKKRGPKPKINAAHKLMLKRKIATLKANGEKVNSRKLIRQCNLSMSRFTVSRYLNEQGMKYKKIIKCLPLKPVDKVKRTDLAKKWLAENHNWERTIFSDEKWFSIDGPDDWSSYVKKNEVICRPKHQIKVGVLWCGPWF